MGKSSRRSRDARVDVMEMWQAPKQSWPAVIVGVLIRWRAEIIVGAVVLTVLIWLNTETNNVVMGLSAAGFAVVVFAVPHSRRFVIARFWCVVDRHRLRTCLRMSRVRTMNLDGALPFLVWARPTKTGERVWVWTRAGSSADELESALGNMASACFAREARLHRVRKLTTLVAIDVIRRDPLDTSASVESPLAWLTSRFGNSGEGSEPIQPSRLTPASAATVQPSTAAAPASAGTARTKPTKTTPSAQPAKPAVAGAVVNGEDLSDYID